MNSQFGDEDDVLDVVALAGIDEPPLQAFRNSNPFDEDSYKVSVVPAATNQLEINEPPLQLLRRASETVTSHILADLEPEKQHLLAGAEQRPQPPPRGHGLIRAQQGQSSVYNSGAKRNRQQQPDNKALGPGDKMMQESNVALPTLALSPPLHTKLDIQKFPEDFNNGQTASGAEDGTGNGIGGGGGGGGGGGDAATIILTPTSLNLTNVASNGGGGGRPTSAGEPRHSDEYKGPKWWRHLVLHWSLISEHVSLLVIFLGLWSMAWVLLPDYAQPQAVIMRIAFLFVGAQISGILVTFVHLPDMLGMLFFGVLYTNLGLANFEGYQRLELFLREMALINIMLLAGLGLDGDAFKRLWFMILRLTLVPTIVEVAVIAGLAYLTLSMPWLWGIALGLVITAVSPNVVVTVMLKLKEDRLGLNSGIHTLIYAMTTCNDVVAIFMFGVIISVIFSTSSLTQQVLQGPIGIGIGLVFGYLYGMMLQYLPSRNAVYANGLRFVLTILGGTIAVMGSRVIGYTSAGALGCVTTAFIARIGWKREESKLSPQQLQAHQISSVPKRLDLMWKFLKPVSFALIGKEINFAVLEGHVIGFGALLVLLGSLLRLAFAYLSTYGGNLSRKERAYITISGFPKATVQAALGPVALDLARAATVANETQLALASNVLIISVLAIIFTAPLGAILMLRLAPYWLKHGDAVEEATTPTTPVVNPTTLSISNANKTA